MALSALYSALYLAVSKENISYHVEAALVKTLDSSQKVY